MIWLALALALQSEAPNRTAAIYRCPAKEAETEKLAKLIDEDGYDGLCIDPKPGPHAKLAAKGKVRFFTPSQIDTKANLKWRNATISFAAGKISPKQWVAETSGLHETVHFLTSPSTIDLRTVMSTVPVDPGQTYSGRSVFAEMFMLSQPGRVCFTSTDVWSTRELPEAGRLQSWVLAMNDWLGPMLNYRHEKSFLVTGKPVIIRADAKPGLLIFRQGKGKGSITFYVNNSFEPIELPKINEGKVIPMSWGLNLEGHKQKLNGPGYVIEES